MFMCVSRCATVCIHSELLSCPASVAGGSGAQAAEAQGEPAACTELVMQIPTCCQASFLLQLSPTWWTILHLDYFRDLSQESAVIITNKEATWAVPVLILLIFWSFQDSIPLGRDLGYTSQQGKEENEWKGTPPGLHHNHLLCIYIPAMMPGMKLGNRSRVRQPLPPSTEWEITVWFSAKHPGLESHH